MATFAHSFVGQWLTTFGWLTLEQRGAKLAGAYQYGNTEGFFEGVVEGNNLRFHYKEPNEEGEGVFRLLRAGKFTSTYSPAGDPRARRWEGERGWDGIWDSDFGRVRLLHEADRVHGSYEGAGSSHIDGHTAGDNKLEFRYKEPRNSGEGHFELSEDHYSFAVEWRPTSTGASADWRPWRGHRVQPERGVTWLLVLEATGSAASPKTSTRSVTCCARCSRACRRCACGSGFFMTLKAWTTGAVSCCMSPSPPS